MKCCNTELKIETGKQNGIDLHYYICKSCGKKGKGKTPKDAEIEFNKSKPLPVKKVTNAVATKLPDKPAGLVKWSNDNLPALINQSAQFIDKPATQRMIEKNIRYVSGLSGASWDKIWKSEEGRESISVALADAFYHAALLPEMGSIVPFGNNAEFIPSVECFENALGSGKNAPFRDINIILIHENDQTKPQEIVNGNFAFSYIPIIPRGEPIAVVVFATRTDNNKCIGEIYDEKRLMQKAFDHSPSYKNYVIEKENFQRLRTENKLLKDDSGREYYVKKITYKKDGASKTWDKPIYEHDLINPYDGPDKPEMLRKSAGKSFFRKYMKVRNASAMTEEWNEYNNIDDDASMETAADNVLSQAARQFEIVETDDKPIKEAEIIEKPKKEKEDSGIDDL